MKIHLAVLALLSAGCSTTGDTPLIFGATHTVGVTIGGSAAETGGEFVLGYKGQQLAIVPISSVQQSSERFIGAVQAGHQDSYSVFGQFSTEARQGQNVSADLGKFFATGYAAKNLAEGFSRKLGGRGRSRLAECGGTPKPADSAGDKRTEAERDADHKRRMEVERGRQSHEVELVKGRYAHELKMAGLPSRAGGSAGQSGAGAARMIFGQYDYLALAFDGSAVESGLRLTLGYKTRNAAIIPVVGRDAAGNLVHLLGEQPSGHDVLSVLGRFKNDNLAGVQESKLTRQTGLESFFTTGAAAQVLSEGFEASLCEGYVAPK